MKIRLIASLLGALALVFGASAAQAAPQVQTLANISNDGPADNGDNEVDIAINPTNASNMIAGWNDYGVGNSCGVGLDERRRPDLAHGLVARDDAGRWQSDVRLRRRGSLRRLPERRNGDLRLQRVEQQEADGALRHDVDERGPDLGTGSEGGVRGDEGRQPRPSDDDDRPLRKPRAPCLHGVERASGELVCARLRLEAERRGRGRTGSPRITSPTRRTSSTCPSQVLPTARSMRRPGSGST